MNSKRWASGYQLFIPKYENPNDNVFVVVDLIHFRTPQSIRKYWEPYALVT
ncbi:hypothetical protein [uncultured Robinsoniella sp.]|uniref:hypothetical protein n=1 Tax=uncultured Robinsoniella sp. TaxID=904190 RepID=UPI00374EEF0A